MMRERMSRPSSSVPNQCADEGESRRAGRLIAAGSCGAIQGANAAKIRKMMTNASPTAASGLWRAFLEAQPEAQPATFRGREMAAVDMSDAPTISQVGPCGNAESFQNRS